MRTESSLPRLAMAITLVGMAAGAAGLALGVAQGRLLVFAAGVVVLMTISLAWALLLRRWARANAHLPPPGSIRLR